MCENTYHSREMACHFIFLSSLSVYLLAIGDPLRNSNSLNNSNINNITFHPVRSTFCKAHTKGFFVPRLDLESSINNVICISLDYI